METILQLSRRIAHNSSPSSMDMKYSPTESLKLSNRDSKRIERRKPNWTEAENVFLLDQFGIHREILTCKATDASTNLKKQEIWRLICQNLNTHNTLVRRTPAEVRRKWKNLVTAAKKEVWEMRHQLHLSGGAGANGRKISELSQRVLQLHSSGGFSSANPNGLYGTLLSAGLIGPPSMSGGHGVDKYGGKYDDDKSYIPAHFTPIITLSESNNNHISLLGAGNHSRHSGDGPPSPLSEDDDDESSDSRNATEFMSDSGIYEQEGIDLRVNVSGRSSVGVTNGVGSGGVCLNMENGKRQLLLKNSDPGEDDDDVDCDDDVEVEDMSLIRFASHLGLREKFGKNSQNPFITSALLNNNRNSSNHINNNNHNMEDNINTGSYNSRPMPIQQMSNGTGGGRTLSDDNDGGHRKSSETTEEMCSSISTLNGSILDATLKLRNHFMHSLKESDILQSLYKERLELQIEVLKLRKQKLSQDLDSKKNHKRIITNGVHQTPVPIPFSGMNKKFRMMKERRRNRFSNNNYFRLKPKNTWINFAVKEKLVSDQDEKLQKNLEKVGNKIEGKSMVNGGVPAAVNGNAGSDHDHQDQD